MKKYGKIISKLRKEKGLTQEALGKKLNVSYQAVSKWENDLSEPDLATLENLVDVLGVSMTEFFELSKNEDKNKQDSTTNSQSTNIQTQIYSSDKTNIYINQTNNPNNKFNFENFVKTKTWVFVAIMTSIVFILSLFAIFVPAKLSNDKIYQKVNPSVFCITAEGSSLQQAGSGFFINNSGLAVTNYHVIENCKKAKIQLNNGKTYDVLKVIGCDEDKDIAIIQIDIKKSCGVTFGNSNKLKFGQVVYAIGYPESFILGSVDSTFTQGIISKTSYSIEGNTYIQCTADITNGNSGGALVDEYGRVIGITTAKFSNANYINMCIPINEIKSVKRNFDVSMEEYYDMHKVFYFYSDNSVWQREKYLSGNKILKIPAPSRLGYIFDGWWTSKEFTEMFNFDEPLTNQTACYAKWIPHKYTIHFDANGAPLGTMQDFVVNYGDKVKLPKNEFIHPHYKFIKWESEDKRYSFTDEQTIEDLTWIDNFVIEVKAVWQMDTYTIRFDGNGVSGYMQDITLGYFDVINLPEVRFSKEGYVLKHWKFDDQFFEDRQEVSQLAGDNEKIRLVAIWEPITYYIEFISDNEKNERKIQEVKYNEKVKLLANTFTYSENEKAFYEWKLESEGSQYNRYFKDQQEILNLTTIHNQTLIFKACWRQYYYIFKFDTNGGEGTFNNANVRRHGSFQFPDKGPSKGGYSFSGWVYNDQVYYSYGRLEDVDFGIEDMPKEITFVAKYTAKTYKINYYESKEIYSAGRIEYINLLDTQIMTYDVPTKLKDGFTLFGRKLKGWIMYVRCYDCDNGYDEYKYDIGSEHKNFAYGGEVDLVADWVGVEFDVVYHNLSGPNDTTTKTVREKYNEKEEINSKSNSILYRPTTKGYNFTGWTFNDVFYESGTRIFYADDMNIVENGVYHFYANWEDAPTCTIQFIANDGEGEMQSVTVYAQNYTYYELPKCLFTRPGYTFYCWTLNKAAEDKLFDGRYQPFDRYQPGESIEISAADAGKTITVWANWKKIEE